MQNTKKVRLKKLLTPTEIIEANITNDIDQCYKIINEVIDNGQIEVIATSFDNAEDNDFIEVSNHWVQLLKKWVCE